MTCIFYLFACLFVCLFVCFFFTVFLNFKTNTNYIMLRLLLVSIAALVVVATPIPDHTLDKDWEMWKDYHGKKYDDKHSELKRRMIWEENLNTINRHNLEYRMGMHTYTMGMNFYSDMVSFRCSNKL